MMNQMMAGLVACCCTFPMVSSGFSLRGADRDPFSEPRRGWHRDFDWGAVTMPILLIADQQGASHPTLGRVAAWASVGAMTLARVSGDRATNDTEIKFQADSTDVDMQQVPDINSHGWIELFNGNDLTGWRQRNGTATYRVEEAAILGKTADGSPNSFLCTEKEFGDFELTFEVHCDPELNSGVQIRSSSKPEFNQGRVHGPQVEIENSPGESGYVYSEGTGRGWITKEQSLKHVYRNGQWNRYVVRAVGDRIQTWVNDQLVADVCDPESPSTGFIGLQVHGIPKGAGPFQVRWRDLRIRPL